MPPNTPTRALLDEMIDLLSARDFDDGSEQARLDFRCLLLTKNARALLDLPDLAADAAIVQYAVIGSRLTELFKHDLLREDQLVGLLTELDAVFAKWRPDLTAQLQQYRDLNATESPPHA